MLTDFPKICCPFIRQTFKVDPEDFRRGGAKFGLRLPEAYLVVDRVNPGYEWVFEDSETIAVEKLNGTNIKIKTEKGRLVAMQNRKNVIDPLQIVKGKIFLLEGIVNSSVKDLVKEDGEQAGELIGPKLQGNPYGLDHHLWYPFDKAVKDLSYRSFLEHARTFDNWEAWFREHLLSRFVIKKSKPGAEKEKVFAEGVVFYNFRRKAEGKTHMAKLRRDMYPWFYEGLKILDYDKQGRDQAEDQEAFD